MSYSANPNKPKKSQNDPEAVAAARQLKQDKERIRALIIKLGDDNKKVLGQIRGLVGALEDDVELHGELMAETVLDCARSLPMKSCIYAAWVTRMAEKHELWAGSVVEQCLEELRVALRGGRAGTAQLLLRFLVCLGNTGALGLPLILKLLQEVFAISEGLRASKGGDFGVYMALASLSYVSPAVHEQLREGVNGIIAGCETYLASREARWNPLLRILKTEELPDRLEALGKAVKAHRQAAWASQAVLHVPGFKTSDEGSPGMPSVVEGEALLGVTADEIRKSKIRMQVPLVASRLLSSKLESDGADDQMSEQDRWILEDHILMTVEMFGRDVDECSKQILRIPVLHPHFDAVTIETVFSQLLRLPTPPMLPLFYSRMLEALTEKQESMIDLVQQAFRTLFDRAAELDEECMEVLAETFANHLMHKGYQFDWTSFTRENVTVQAQRLIRRAFERLQRLSFHENLMTRLPEPVRVYVPPEPVPASDLPALTKPEFTKMLGLVKIKDPSEEKVLKYCNKLMRLQTKEEQKDEHKAPGAAPQEAAEAAMAPPVEVPPSSVQEKKEEAEEEAAAEEPATKKHRAEDTKEAKDPLQAEAVAGAPKAEEGGDNEKEEPEAKRRRLADDAKGGADAEDKSAAPLQVKQEPKEEGGGSAGTAPAGTGAVAEEEDSPPSEAWSLEAVIELLTVAVLQNGSKTPTHMSKILDGYQQVFLKLRPSAVEEAHACVRTLVRCVFEFWRLSSQRLEITLAALLYRSLATPRAVVEVALAERGPKGCDSIAVWNTIHSVARKSLERRESVRAELAIAKRLDKQDVLEKNRKQLDEAVRENAELFTTIFTCLVRNHQDFEDNDAVLRKITLQRVMTIGRKYHAFIKPLLEAAASTIPGVAHNSEVSSVFESLGVL